MIYRAPVLLALLVCSLLGCAGNEIEDTDLPAGWRISGRAQSGYRAYVQSSSEVQDGSVLVLESRVEKAQGFVTLLQEVQAYDYRGKALRVSAFLKTDSVERRAVVWMRVDGLADVLSFDDMSQHPVTGTTEWAEYGVQLQVPPDAMNLAFGVYLDGPGKVLVDWFRFESLDPASVGAAGPSRWKRPSSPGGPTVPVNLGLVPSSGSS